mgnify:FL=1
MKNLIKCCTLALFLFINISYAQTKNEILVSKCVDELKLAMINGDAVMLDKLTE